MPKYETNQRVVGFIRRLPAEFTGFATQSVSMSGETVQLLQTRVFYQARQIFIAVYTRPGQNHDTMVLSLPLFYIPEQKSAELYEQLLDWNNGATGMVHFAVDEVLGTVNLVCVRPVEGITFQDFHACMANLCATHASGLSALSGKFALKEIRDIK